MSDAIGAAFVRPDFPVAVPTLRTRGADRLLEFVGGALEADVEQTTRDDAGRLVYAAVRFAGGGVVEVSEANERWSAAVAAVHLYVPDVDRAHAAALERGARELYAPAQMPYGERSSGFEDPFGNHWYLATYTG